MTRKILKGISFNSHGKGTLDGLGGLGGNGRVQFDSKYEQVKSCNLHTEIQWNCHSEKPENHIEYIPSDRTEYKSM